MRILRKWLLATLAVLVLIAAAIYSITRPPALPNFLANRTDAYEKTLAVIAELGGDPRDATNNIADYIQKNQLIFQKFAALPKEPLEPPSTFYEPGGLGTNFIDFHRFGLALLLKSQLAQQQQNWTEASDLCLETIRFGQNLESGPLINFMIGTAIELRAATRLGEILPHLPKTNLTAALFNLSGLQQSRPSFEDVMERERYFAAKNSTNVFDLVKHQITFRKRAYVKTTVERSQVTIAKIEVLIAAIGARLYASEQKAAPKTFADLVPKYIPSIPQDPFSNAPLILTNSTTNTIIYSIGLNKRDDAGKADDIRYP